MIWFILGGFAWLFLALIEVCALMRAAGRTMPNAKRETRNAKQYRGSALRIPHSALSRLNPRLFS